MSKSAFTDAYAAFVRALAAARMEAGLTQTEVAERMGWEQPTISLTERGVRRLDVIEFYAFARAIGADPGELFASIAKTLPARVSL